MIFSLNEKDEKKLVSLFIQHDKNIDYYIYLAKVLTEFPKLLTDKEIKDIEDKSDFEKKNIAFDRLEKLYPINSDFIKDNIRWDTALLSIKYCINNPYLKALNNLTFKEAGWTLTRNKSKAYTLLPYQEEYAYGGNYNIKMGLTMFKSDYIYPSIRLYDTEWMSLNQHEIRTMEIPIQLAKGKVLTLGLGIGYYAYMVSLKEEVKEVHIVEMDLELIKVFNKYLLPLFPYPEKIHIHKADAFYFIKEIKDRDYDFIFSDLWHNVSDGVGAYLKLKKHFNNFKYTKCTYWIEGSILAYLRLLVIGVMKDEYESNSPIYDELQIFIRDRLKDYELKTTNDIDGLLNLKGLNKLFFF